MMEAIEILRALNRSAPASSGNYPDAGTLADELGIKDHSACYDLMQPVLGAGWARVVNPRACEWDHWAVTAKGRRELAKAGAVN